MHTLVAFIFMSILVGCSSADFGAGTMTKKVASKEKSVDEKDPQDEEDPKDAPEPSEEITDGDPLSEDNQSAEDDPNLNTTSDDFGPGPIAFEDGELEFKKTRTVAVVFEDSNNPKAWKARDIRICVKGKFGYNLGSRVFRGGDKAAQKIEINAYKNPTAACRHRFVIEIKDKDGNTKREEKYETSATEAFSSSDFSVEFGEELLLSWEWISGTQCQMFGKDSHKRTTTNSRPEPKIYVDECGDFSR